MRIALVRGPNLNAWEMQSFQPMRHEVVAFGSRGGAFDEHGHHLPVRRLPSASDLLRRMPGLVQAGVARFGGSADHLVGLEDALRGFDVAHVAELRNPYSAQALAARDAGAVRRVVATVWENIAFLPPENDLVARRVARVAAGADHFVAVTERAGLHLEMEGVEPERITVQPMGIDLTRFAAGAKAAASGPLRILSVARLVPEKGIVDLVLAVGLLRRRGVKAHLRLVGAGPLGGRIPELARRAGVADAVELAGTIRHDEVAAAYAEAEVFVLASGPRETWREQFGYAVVEAMASGLPVVAGQSGSLMEVVADRDSLVVPHDPSALADHLAALAADPAERRRQGARNRAWAETRYDCRAAARTLEAIYERVLAQPARVGA